MASAPDCTDIEILYFDYIRPAIWAVVLLSMIYPIYRFTNSYITGNLKTTKLLFYLGITMYSLIFILFIMNALWDMYTCHDYATSLIFDGIGVFIYNVQGLLLIIILFTRLHTIFVHTIYKLSQCTITIWIVYMTVGLLLSIIGRSIEYSNNDLVTTIGSIIFLSSGGMFIIAIIWINGLFIYKLYLALKVVAESMDQAKHNKLINLITQHVLLTFISTFTVIGQLVFVILGVGDISPHANFIKQFVIIFDLYSNFLSILLTYNYFHPWYIKMCGCCHKGCYKCWTNCFGNKNVSHQDVKEKEEVKQMEMTETETL